MAKQTASTTPQPEGETRQKHLRRSERARLVAKLGEAGSPWAGAAASAHKEVSDLEDQLQSKRTALMSILGQVKVKVPRKKG